MITMIDYGIGNYRSVQKAFESIGAKITLTRDVDEIANADKLILPGVGAFGASIDAVRERNQEEAILHAVAKGTPFLGICVGMQLLLDRSEEMGTTSKGLGLISGSVTKFPEVEGLKVPHMGWNQLQHDQSSALLKDVPVGGYAYFVHSFCCQPENQDHALATTEYGCTYASVLGKDNVFGIQFHGEKSQRVGLQILTNYNNL